MTVKRFLNYLQLGGNYMAGLSLLALLDDITAVLDDVAAMTKVAAQKTAGVLGDDLALNAEQVSGVRAERELPVVWAVAKGSLVNKAILVPCALLISALAPWLVIPLLMLGGTYLCYEGAEKIFHAWDSKKKRTHSRKEESLKKEIADLITYEKLKIKGAIRTDFVLSAEIIVIALGTVPANSALVVRAGVLILIAILMTGGVYGVVAGIVKLDDIGFWLLKKNSEPGLRRRLGSILVGSAPYLMRLLTVVGTAAMFLVGGGILAHGLPFLNALHSFWAEWPVAWLWKFLSNSILGLLAGTLAWGIMIFLKRFFKRRG